MGTTGPWPKRFSLRGSYIWFQGFEVRNYGVNAGGDAFSNYPGGHRARTEQNDYAGTAPPQGSP